MWLNRQKCNTPTQVFLRAAQKKVAVLHIPHELSGFLILISECQKLLDLYITPVCHFIWCSLQMLTLHVYLHFKYHCRPGLSHIQHTIVTSSSVAARIHKSSIAKTLWYKYYQACWCECAIFATHHTAIAHSTDTQCQQYYPNMPQWSVF